MIPSSHPFSLSSLFFDMNWLWYKICSRKLTIGTLHYNHTALTNAIVVSQFVHIISIWYPNIDWVLNTGNIGHWNWNLMVEKKNNNIQQSEILYQSVKIWYCSYTYDIVSHRKSKWSANLLFYYSKGTFSTLEWNILPIIYNLWIYKPLFYSQRI